MWKVYRLLVLLLCACVLGGCVTVGYSHVRDPNLLGYYPVTVVSVSRQNIYSAAGAEWVGALAKVEAVGVRVSIISGSGEHYSIVQPNNPSYQLKAGEPAIEVADYGRVWVQPASYPLPPEFTVKKHAHAGNNRG